jgi:putative restriction endonuclease
MQDRPWTREEVILCIRLYCELPYKKLRQSTPEVIELARLMGRTPSAISMRCCNYVQFDPEESKRVKGFKNAAKLDSKVWSEINNDWEKFAFESENLLKEYRSRQKTPVIQDDNKKQGKLFYIENNFPIGRTQEQTIRVRIGQHFFRKVVLAAYDYQCCITGIHNNTLLIASHIKPWKDSDPKVERTNPRNGLCLSPLYDKAFDAGLMTIDEQYHIVFSNIIQDCANKATINRFFKHYNGKSIALPERFIPDQKYLEYHRNNIFQTVSNGVILTGY